jgi:hypothetical protein
VTMLFLLAAPAMSVGLFRYRTVGGKGRRYA